MPHFIEKPKRGRGSLFCCNFSMENNELSLKIREMAESNLPDPSVFVLDVVIKGTRRKNISIVLDGDQGVTIDQCVHVSRSVGELLDEQDLIPDAYVLEVASPGAEEPLRLRRQYPPHIGRRLEITTTEEKIHIGKLEAVTETGLAIAEEIRKKGSKKVEIVPTQIPFEQIASARVLIAFK